MQIHRHNVSDTMYHLLHKNLYRLYLLVASEKSRSDFEKLCEEQIRQSELQHSFEIFNKKKHGLLASTERAPYYRCKKWLRCPNLKYERHKNV